MYYFFYLLFLNRATLQKKKISSQKNSCQISTPSNLIPATITSGLEVSNIVTRLDSFNLGFPEYINQEITQVNKENIVAVKENTVEIRRNIEINPFLQQEPVILPFFLKEEKSVTAIGFKKHKYMNTDFSLAVNTDGYAFPNLDNEGDEDDYPLINDYDVHADVAYKLEDNENNGIHNNTSTPSTESEIALKRQVSSSSHRYVNLEYNSTSTGTDVVESIIMNSSTSDFSSTDLKSCDYVNAAILHNSVVHIVPSIPNVIDVSHSNVVNERVTNENILVSPLGSNFLDSVEAPLVWSSYEKDRDRYHLASNTRDDESDFLLPKEHDTVLSTTESDTEHIINTNSKIILDSDASQYSCLDSATKSNVYSTGNTTGTTIYAESVLARSSFYNLSDLISKPSNAYSSLITRPLQDESQYDFPDSLEQSTDNSGHLHVLKEPHVTGEINTVALQSVGIELLLPNFDFTVQSNVVNEDDNTHTLKELIIKSTATQYSCLDSTTQTSAYSAGNFTSTGIYAEVGPIPSSTYSIIPIKATQESIYDFPASISKSSNGYSSLNIRLLQEDVYSFPKLFEQNMTITAPKLDEGIYLPIHTLSNDGGDTQHSDTLVITTPVLDEGIYLYDISSNSEEHPSYTLSSDGNNDALYYSHVKDTCNAKDVR